MGSLLTKESDLRGQLGASSAIVDIFLAILGGDAKNSYVDREGVYHIVYEDPVAPPTPYTLTKEYRDHALGVNRNFYFGLLGSFFGLPIGRLSYIKIEQLQYTIDKLENPEEVFAINLALALAERFYWDLSEADIARLDMKPLADRFGIKRDFYKYTGRWPYMLFGDMALDIFRSAYSPASRETIVKNYLFIMSGTDMGSTTGYREAPKCKYWMFPGLDYRIIDGVPGQVSGQPEKKFIVPLLAICEEILSGSYLSLPYRRLLFKQYSTFWPPFIPVPEGETKVANTLYKKATLALGFRDAKLYDATSVSTKLALTLCQEGGDVYSFLFIAKMYEMFYTRSIPLGPREVSTREATNHTVWQCPTMTGEDMWHDFTTLPPGPHPPDPRPFPIDGGGGNKEVPVIDPINSNPIDPTPPDPIDPKPPVPTPYPVVIPVKTTTVKTSGKYVPDETSLVLIVEKEEDTSATSALVGLGAVAAGAYVLLKKRE
jgi:hypothetical protein